MKAGDRPKSTSGPLRMPVRIGLSAAIFFLSVAALHAEPAGTRFHEVPATTDWGMFIMVILVLTASSVALYGGGFLHRSMVDPHAGPTAIPTERPARSKPRRKRTPRLSFRRPRRNRSIRQALAMNRHVARSSQSKKRRDGPGIRD